MGTENERVLIIGGSGFVGTNLVEHYINHGASVLNLDRRTPLNHDLKHLWRSVDILDQESLYQAVREFAPHYVLHMAARTDLDGASIVDYAANTKGVSNLIDVLSGVNSVRRVVFTSSMLVCGLGYLPKSEIDFYPNTFYGESKVEGERIVRATITGAYSWLIVRPTSLWGPWFDIPYRYFFDAVAKGVYMHPRNRKTFRSYGYIGNVVFQLDKLLTAPARLVHAKVFYLSDYEPLEIGAWGREIALAFGVHPPREIPLLILRAIAKVGDFVKKIGVQNPPLTSFRLNNMLTEAVFDQEQLYNIVGDCPYSLEQGVAETVRWLQSRKSHQQETANR